MAKTNWDAEHTFEVEGVGQFPFDMLRHSRAWPTSSVCATLLGREHRRRIRLTAAQVRHVSLARWDSFRWPVVAGFDEHGYPCEITS